MDIEAIVKKHARLAEGMRYWDAEILLRAALTELAAEHEAVAQVTKMNSDRLLRKANERIRQLEVERVLEGWQLVPTVPTQEMADAYWLAYDECSEGSHLGTCYAALLAAAQLPKKEGNPMSYDDQMEALGELAEAHPVGGCALPSTPEVRDRCPDCGRLKARKADDAMNGDCDKWFAVRDKEAYEECARIAATTQPKKKEGE